MKSMLYAIGQQDVLTNPISNQSKCKLVGGFTLMMTG